MAIKRDKILKTAEKLVQKGKLEQAIKEYEKLRKASPEDTNTINRLGDLYGRVGDIEEAIDLYCQVAEKFSEQGFLPKAIAMYKKVNRLAPQRLDIFERLGELYIEQGLMVEAKNQFQMLAEHYAKSDDIESAIRANQRLSDIDPDDATTRLRFADLLLESGNLEQAMDAYGALGRSLIEREQIDEAERLFRRLLDHEIPDGEIMIAICDRLLDAGRVTSAQELLTAGLAVSPDSIGLQTIQVRTHMSLGDSDDAVSLAREVLEIDPDNSEVRRIVGSAMIEEGDQEEAAEMMIPAAEALLEKADYSRAQKMLRELAEIAPTDERILRLAIRAFRPSGDQETLTRLTASLADVCYSSGQEDQAKRFYLELVASDPTNQLYRERLAQLDGAVEEDPADFADTAGLNTGVPSEISFSLDDESPGATGISADAGASAGDDAGFDPAERINEAAVFAKYGLNDKAIRHLESVLERVPNHAGAREALAKLYSATGEREKAITLGEPGVVDHRAVEDAEAAATFGAQIDTPGDEAFDDDDDEVIIVEIDGDEVSDSDLDDVVSDVIDFGDLSIEEMIAESVGVEASGQAEPAATEPPAAEPAVEPEVELTSETAEEIDDSNIETETIDEELVELSAGADGPTFNDLAQLDLFIDQELFEDAIVILERLEDDFPDDPDLAQRRAALVEAGSLASDSAASAPEPVPSSPSQEPSVPVETAGPARPAPPEEPAQQADEIFDDEETEDYIDLAKELEEELAEEEAMVEEATGRGKGEALLDEVFKEFQKGVAEQLSEEDSDTHFNLGIAYKEMGLLDEAINEFQVASHDQAFFVEACSMIGVCATELGKFEEAAEWYQKALVAPDLTADARTALRYELASALENTGEIEQAVRLFEEIRNHDPAYRDVGARLAALGEQQRQIN
jgi:tetratricopeptide (TPR) repeat protein